MTTKTKIISSNKRVSWLTFWLLVIKTRLHKNNSCKATKYQEEKNRNKDVLFTNYTVLTMSQMHGMLALWLPRGLWFVEQKGQSCVSM
jgi:hypothetical protein